MVFSEEEIKRVISSTVNELHEAQAVRFTKPETLQGWLYILCVMGGFLAFVWTGIVFLNRVSEHHKMPSHTGTLELLTALDANISNHAQDQERHKEDSRIQLQILHETRPIQQNINDIKQNVSSIRSKVDILLDRQKHNDR
tara:strand:+ start:129 stop:551 length:423 start_codon:yes stop_codon:yes gene_type:complete